MLRPLAAALSATALLAAAAPALAQATDGDARCLLVSNAFSHAEKDPARRQLAEAARFYFMGRLAARLSPDALKTLLIAQGKALPAQAAAPAMNACAQQFQAQERALEAIGQDIVKAQGTPPAKK